MVASPDAAACPRSDARPDAARQRVVPVCGAGAGEPTPDGTADRSPTRRAPDARSGVAEARRRPLSSRPMSFPPSRLEALRRRTSRLSSLASRSAARATSPPSPSRRSSRCRSLDRPSGRAACRRGRARRGGRARRALDLMAGRGRRAASPRGTRPAWSGGASPCRGHHGVVPTLILGHAVDRVRQQLQPAVALRRRRPRGRPDAGPRPSGSSCGAQQSARLSARTSSRSPAKSPRTSGCPCSPAHIWCPWCSSARPPCCRS